VEVESDSLEIAHHCSGEEHIWDEATDVYVKIMSHVGATGMLISVIGGEISMKLLIV
jgi:hypothetical protein